MFTVSKWFRPPQNEANEHGFNCAFLGLDKINPYPEGTMDHKQFEWGWEEGNDLIQEHREAPIHYPSGFGDNEHV